MPTENDFRRVPHEMGHPAKMWAQFKKTRLPDANFVYEPSPYFMSLRDPRKRCSYESDIRHLPVWLLLDHTIAVVWLLNSSKSLKQDLSIEQLQCALVFLKGVKDSAGENPIDIKVCLSQIEELLIDLYAELNNPASKKNAEAKSTNSLHLDSISNATRIFKKISGEDVSTGIDNGGGIVDGLPVKSSIACPVTVDTGKLPNRMNNASRPTVPKKQNGGDMDDSEIGKTTTRRTPQERTDSLNEIPKTVSENAMKRQVHSDKLKEYQGFVSLTYQDVQKKRFPSEMRYFQKADFVSNRLNRLPHKPRSQVDAPDSDEEAVEKLIDLSLRESCAGFTQFPPESKDELLTFLVHCRSKKVQRIENELKQLHSLEKLMTHVDKKGFHAFTNPDMLAKLKDYEENRKIKV